MLRKNHEKLENTLKLMLMKKMVYQYLWDVAKAALRGKYIPINIYNQVIKQITWRTS